ncbi:MAG TPA: hypothetical protein PK400_02610 [Phycisphaerales bacterium]|nr:hypothetical protein [Phycisphaerales bacterium]HRQ75897.1 hypothetical protein [Phycisphaerales bacterium]
MSSTPSIVLNASEAAALLRAARRNPSEASRLVDWVLLAAPDSRSAQRLKIQCLLAERDFESADAMLARALLVRPHDRSFIMLRVKSLIAQSRLQQAECELEAAIIAHPKWKSAIRIAAEVAEQLGNVSRACALYGRLIQLEPKQTWVRDRYIRSLIQSGDVEHAEELLDRTPDAPHVLVARLRKRQGRLLDAVELLHEAVAASHTSSAVERDEALLLLLESLEEIGELRTAQRLASEASSRCPAARLHTGLLLLRQGRFVQAVREMAKLRDHENLADDALRTLCVAAALSGRPRLAKRAAARVSASGRTHIQAMIERWRRGMIGRVVRNQQSAKTAGADPCSSLLTPLIGDALSTFDALARDAMDAAGPVDPAEIRRHRAACIEAMGAGL